MAERELIIKSTHRGLRYEDGRLTDVLEAGRHVLPKPSSRWVRRPTVEVVLVDMRERELTIKGQEILTSDKVAVRVSILTQFRVVDPVAAKEKVETYEDRLYSDVQLAARRSLASMTLETILTNRNQLSEDILAELQNVAGGYGVTILRADVKDIVFPGNGLVDEVVATVLQPTVDEMARRGTPFGGLLYAGLALTSHGVRVIEFNARFGDPETQVVLARLRTPLGSLLHAAATGRLAEVGHLTWTGDAAVTVVVASKGYPEAPRTGDPVEGLAEAAALEGVSVLHAGTALDGFGRVVSSGGRVLSVVGTGPDVPTARDRAYVAVSLIRLDGGHHRTDIASGIG